MPKVSIIIPVYNAEQYLERCLNSIVNQTLRDIEIICVDDCSIDKSLEILNNYAKKDNRFQIIHCDKNGGESRARNIGLDKSTGEYLAFVDNDDYLDLNFYEELYSESNRTKAEIVRGEVKVFNYKGRDIVDNINKNLREFGSKLYFAYYWWTAIYSSELIKKNNLRFLEGYPLGGDVLFLNEAILKCKKLGFIDGTFYNYIRRENSGDSAILTNEKIESVLKIHQKILDNTLEYYKTNPNEKCGIEYVCKWCFDAMNSYSYRLKTLENLRYCTQESIIAYHKIDSHMNTKFLKFSPLVENLYRQNDINELVNYNKKYNTWQKKMISNLRFKHMNISSNKDILNGKNISNNTCIQC